jgi:hypothetical protein
MDIGTLIPQLFYDVIGRIIPGATLLGTSLILFEGPFKALRHLATWSDDTSNGNISIALIVMGNLLASHILASLLGGIWFRVFRIKCYRELKGFGKYLNAWAKKGEDRIEHRFKQAFDDKHPPPGDIGKMSSPTDRIAFMYDYVLLRCPKAGARIAKLRAEQHMSGVLMIGFLVLALICYWFPYIKESVKETGLIPWVVVELLLIAAVISSGALAWHLEKRCGAALFNLWLLASTGNDEK